MDRTSLVDLMIDAQEWQFESDWSPRISRKTLNRLERDGMIEVNRADTNDWAVRRVSETASAS